MENETIEPGSNDKAARWALAALALVLIAIEVSQILYNYRVVETYARPDQTGIFAAVDRMAVAHGIRIAVIATLILGWRWSLWAIVFAFLAAYIPNPWVSRSLMNTMSFALFLLPLFMVAQFLDKRLLFPWRSSLK
jgi:hypothetical protein